VRQTRPIRARRRASLPASLAFARRLAPLLAALLAWLLVWGAPPARAGTPELAAAASVLLPGTGQAINGDYAEGAAYAGLYLVLLNQFRQTLNRPDYIPISQREDDVTHTIRINRSTVIADQYGTATLDVAFYSSYAAYRDARAMPGHAEGYTTPAPQESLADLAVAPFSWDWLKRPTTFAPLLIPLYLAIAPAAANRLVYMPDQSIGRDELRLRFFAQHEGVAVGEEAFFRGVLNNGFSDVLGEWGGLAASSTVFGLAHQGNAGQANALGAGLLGAYLGYLQQHNGYAIGQGVAIHFWWNFLASLAFLKTHEHATVVPVQIYLRF
jgi:CAAX protease family protein